MSADTAAQKLAAISRWIDESPANVARDPEAALWGRVSKVGEEFGEAIQALVGATGQNPRKGVTNTMQDVIEELLDTALTATCAVEHLTGNHGHALAELSMKIEKVYTRAGLGGAA